MTISLMKPGYWHTELLLRRRDAPIGVMDVYQGLYRFKQKFEPEWRPIYLCGWPDLPWRVLPDLSWASRHLHLVGYAALQRVLGE